MLSKVLQHPARLAAVALAACVPASAQEVRTIVPSGAVRGQELDTTVYGRGLGDVVGAWCVDRGVEVLGAERDRDNRGKLRLRVRDDAEFGRHLVHVFTERGIAAPIAFHVGPLPVVVEDRDATTRERPQPIALDTTVEGGLDAEDVDWFAFDVAAGQRVTIECEALRLGISRIDPEIELFTADGESLARADDSAFGRYDPVLTWTFDVDCRALVAIRDVALRGSSLHRYRLHVGSFPRPVAVVPSGGVPGATVDATWIESDGTRHVAAIPIPHRPGGFHAFPIIDGRVPPTGLPMRIAVWPSRIEGADVPQADGPEVEPPTAPFAVHGVLAAGESRDRFRFRAGKGERLEIRSLARLLGSPLDAVLVVRDADGRGLASGDDSGGPDSLVRFRAPADGVYLVDVRDHLGRGGPTFAWRVEVAPADDRFLVTPGVPGQRAERFAISVPRGGRTATLLRAVNLDGEAGIRLGLANLPAGVTAVVPGFVPGADQVPVVFAAAVDAPLAASGAVPTAIAAAEPIERPVAFEHAVPLVRVDNDRVYLQTRADELPVAVAAESPFALDCPSPPIPLIRGSSFRLAFELQRTEGFDGTVTVRMPWTPPGIGAGTATLRKGETSGSLYVNARGDAPTRDWAVVLTATSSIDGVERTVSSDVVRLRVDAPWLDVTLEPVRTEQGVDVVWPLSISRRIDFDGEIEAQIERLPKGVAVSLPALEPGPQGTDPKRLELPVTVAADAQVGRHRQPFLRLHVKTAAGSVHHVFGAGELRIDRPLSPELKARLDAKRRAQAAGGTR